ncbi:MAG: hypothetical protein NC218_08040 [Acetobacter sp.]|nr:hypothetical protein [Acetobacter sp.]
MSNKKHLIEVDADDLLDVLVERVGCWTSDEDIIELYRQMYACRIDNGWYDVRPLNIMDIVDNDYTNYTDIVYQLDFPDDFSKLVSAYNAGNFDVSCEEFEYISAGYVAALDEEKGMALVEIA